MNRHEIVSRVYDHLMTQGEKCTQGNDPSVTMCLYRHKNKNGKMLACAIGALIDDKHWKAEWNAEGVEACAVGEALEKSGIKFDTDSDINFLSSLQSIHDANKPDKWEKKFGSFLNKWEL